MLISHCLGGEWGWRLLITQFLTFSCACFQLNPSVNAFQRKYVSEIKRCEEMERILGKHSLIFNMLFGSKVHYLVTESLVYSSLWQGMTFFCLGLDQHEAVTGL